VCGPAPEYWNPETVAQQGAGGSETAVVEMASRLAKMGHKVRVYGAPGIEATYEGVDYYEWKQDSKPECDVLVAWRVAHFLTQGQAKVRLMWCHDTEAIGMNYGLSLLADRFLALSKWHAKNLVEKHQIHESQVFVTRNGISKGAFMGLEVERDRLRAVYCSSPDRGLGLLLDLWPEIGDAVYERVGERPSLTVAYGFTNWNREAESRKDQQHRFLVSTLQRRMRDLDADEQNVTHLGRVNKASLAKLLRSSGAWLYPTPWTETSCILAMESRAAGLRIVTSKLAALPETVGKYGVLIEGDWLSEAYQREFVAASVDALTMTATEGVNSREEISKVALRDLDWQGVADEWCKLFRELMSAAKHGALPAYREYQQPEVV
jgi:glycosyltransferase involved in cell wall biosynthesis